MWGNQKGLCIMYGSLDRGSSGSGVRPSAIYRAFIERGRDDVFPVNSHLYTLSAGMVLMLFLCCVTSGRLFILLIPLILGGLAVWLAMRYKMEMLLYSVRIERGGGAEGEE